MFLNILAKVNMNALGISLVMFLQVARVRELLMHMQIAGTYFAYLMSNSSPGTCNSFYTNTNFEAFAE